MNPNQGREAAYVKSRVKDLSLITNAPDYVGLFACITPKAHADLENDENITYMENGSPTSTRVDKNKVYLPQLVRDVETLINLFGDPRVDPNTYKDLLSVLNIVQNGFACYIAKVKSGNSYQAAISSSGLFNSYPCQVNNQLYDPDYSQLYEDLQNIILFTAQSSIVGKNKIILKLIPYKPYNINQVSLELSFTSQATDASEEVNIVTTRVILTPDTKNSDFIKTLNSYLGGDLVCQLSDYMDDSVYATPYDAYASIESDNGKYFCIVNALLYISGIYTLNDPKEYLISDNMKLVGLDNDSVRENWLQYYNKNKEHSFKCDLDNGGVDNIVDSTLNVTQTDYINSINTFNDPKYSGTFISELSSDVTHLSIIEKSRFIPKPNPEYFKSFGEDISSYIQGDPLDTSSETPTTDTQIKDDRLKNAFINSNQYNYRVNKDTRDSNVTHVTYKDQYKYVGVCKEYVGASSESGTTKTYVLNKELIKNAKQDGNPIIIFVAERTDVSEDPSTSHSYKLTDGDLAESVKFNDSDPIEAEKVYFICKDPNIEDDNSAFRVSKIPVTPETDTENTDTLIIPTVYDNGNIQILLDTYDPDSISDEDPTKTTSEGWEPLTSIFDWDSNNSKITTGEDIRDYPVFELDLDTDKSAKEFFTRASINADPTYYVAEDENDIVNLRSYIPIVEAVEKDVQSGEWKKDSTINDHLHQREENALMEMKGDDRRGLHYMIKQLAAVRKNLTCIFTTPYCPLTDNDTYDSNNIYDLNTACNWVSARGEFADLFEYGNAQAIEYSEQAFYCEMYWSWVKWRVVKLVNGLATGSATVIVPATSFVILNALLSYRTKGSFYPVAGDQGGVLPDSCVILQNPSTKSQRDKLISYRINPIFDTGVRGIQIYGNETLNPQFTDLSAAHIARTLVQIRSQVDAYSETIKFKLNDIFTWSSWISYVSTKILDPIKSLGGLRWYQVNMGRDTTTNEEIAARKIRGMISLQFTPDLEIIDLEFVIMASSLELGTE